MKRKTVLWSVLSATFLLCMLALLLAAYAGPPATVEAAPARLPLQTDATCTTFHSLDVPKAIPDHTITYTTSLLRAAMPGKINAITVTLSVSHTYPADLRIELCTPGRTDCLLTDEGLTWESGVYTVSFSSYGTDPVYYYDPPYTDSYAAEDPLERFIGHSASGAWQLLVRDKWSGDTGYLTAWSLDLCTTPDAATITPTPSPTASATVSPIPASDCAFIYYVDPAKSYDPSAGYSNAKICGDLLTPNPTIAAAFSTAVPAATYEYEVESNDAFVDPGWYGAKELASMWPLVCFKHNYTIGSMQSTNHQYDKYGAFSCFAVQQPVSAVRTLATRSCLAETIVCDCDTPPCDIFGLNDWIVNPTNFSTTSYDGYIFGLTFPGSFNGSASCHAGYYYNFWQVSVSECRDYPLVTPTPTPTSPCPIITPGANFGWWWMW